MKEKKTEKLYKMKNGGVAAKNEEKDGDGDAERQGE